MAQVTIVEHPSLKLYKTPAIERFLSHFESHWPELCSKVQFKIDLIEADFLLTPDDLSRGPPGPVGWIGCEGPVGVPNERVRELSQADPKLILLSMQAVVEDSFSLPSFEKIKLTPGGRNNFLQSSWKDPITKSEEVTMGVYKNKIFDQVLALIREIHPDFTEEKLAYYGVENRSYGPNDTFTHTCPVEEKEVTPITTYQKYETKPTGRSTLTIQLRECDLLPNLEELDLIFETLC